MGKKIEKIIQSQKKSFAILSAILLVLLYGAWCYAVSDSRAVIAFSCCLALLLAVCYLASEVVSTKTGATPRYGLFLAWLICLGLLYSLVFAPSTVPDEMYHFEASYNLADQLMFLAPTDTSMLVRADDARLISDLFAGDNRLTAGLYEAVSGASFFVQNSALVEIAPVAAFDIGGNPPQLKIAPALGIIVAQLFHLGSYPLFYLGRLFNFAFFVTLVFFAVRITPVGKRAMMMVSLLPMTLHVASSYSYDAGIIGLSFLLTSLCLKAVYGEGLLGVRLCIGIAVVAVLLAPCKVIYILIAALVLFIPAKRFTTPRNAAAFKVGVILLCFTAILILRMASLASLAGSDGGSSLDSRGVETGTFYTLGGLLSDPVNTVLLFVRTFDVMGDTFIKTVVGGSLGWFQPELAAPWYIVMPFLGLLILSTFRTPEDRVEIPLRHRVLAFGVASVGWLAVMLSMALGHTFQTEDVILGVQGRYLIPLLPLLLIAFHGKTVSVEKDTTSLLLWCTALFNVLYLIRLFSIAVNIH